ncbi:hypothetical protein ACGCUQ_07400 [Eubacteriales bacterium KG127]
MKYIRSLIIIVVAIIFIYVAIYFLFNNGDFIYILSRIFGFEEKYAENLAILVVAGQSLFFTSNWFYTRISNFINKRLEKCNDVNRQIYLGYMAGIQFLIALPKRTILFTFYLFLITLESIGMIDKAKDYAVVIIFIIAVDRISKIWPEEKKKAKEFMGNMKKYINNTSEH